MWVCVDVFMWRRPQTVKSQAVLEQRKRGGLKTKLSSEQISCKQQKTGGLKKKKIWQKLSDSVADQTKESVEIQ